MFDRLRVAIRRKGLIEGLWWAIWERVRGSYQPLAYGLPRHVPWLFVDDDDLQRRARRSGDLYFHGSSESFVVERPPGDDPADLAAVAGEYTLSRPFVGVLHDATLVGPYPLAVVDDRVVLDATVSPIVALLNLVYGAGDAVSDPLDVPRLRQTRAFDSAVLLYNCWNSGYYHWVTETLPRLAGVQAYTDRTGDRPTLIVGPDFGGFQRETLELLGYGPDDWVEWDVGRARVDRLVVPSSPREFYTPRGEISPRRVQWLRDEMRTRVAGRVDPDQFSRLVYVSRDDADRRQVSNEAALLDELRPLGFERYLLARMSTVETITLLMHADVVVAPHGAGLTDSLFADDATVVELCRGRRPNTRAYRVLASQAGLTHRYVPCRVDGPDLEADVDAVLAAVTAELDVSATADD
jgi:capsular polysaccharide biosynthesis protein